MRPSLRGVAVCLLAAVTSAAEDPSDEAELLQLLEEQTRIATETRMNADYVPGIVTVLHGEDLELLGARTVWDALGLVPGFEGTINGFGNPLAAVRGVGLDFLTSHLKVFVDSVPVNQSFVGSNHAVMLMPIEQVERLEVMRGPGGALHGEFAFAGVVNVVTRREGRLVYAGAGRFASHRGGGHWTIHEPASELHLNVSAAFLETDGADHFIAEDAIGRQQPQASYAPGEANEDEQLRSLVVALDYRRFSLRIQDVRRRNGLYYGLRTLQPDPDARSQADGYFVVEAQQGFELSPTVHLQARAALGEGRRTFKEHMLPAGFVQRIGGTPVVLPQGQVFLSFHRERRVDGGMDLTWRPSSRHTVLLRVSHGDIDVPETRQESTINVLTGALLGGYRELAREESSRVPEGTGRRITSVGVQEQFEVSDRLALTGGVRYDHFSDVGDSVTPRLAAVIRAGDSHIVKAQYARAFRPPTLQALNLPVQAAAGQLGNPELEPETVGTAELGYIFRKPRLVGRATLFRTEVADLIGQSGRRSENLTDLRFQGAELELDWRFHRRWRALGNLTLYDGKDESTGRGVAGVAERLANLGLLGTPFADVQVGARLWIVGDRGRAAADPRPALAGYRTLDLSASWARPLGLDELRLTAGARNVLDEDVRAPSSPTLYPEDLPRGARTWWARLAWEFRSN